MLLVLGGGAEGRLFGADDDCPLCLSLSTDAGQDAALGASWKGTAEEELLGAECDCRFGGSSSVAESKVGYVLGAEWTWCGTVGKNLTEPLGWGLSDRGLESVGGREESVFGTTQCASLELKEGGTDGERTLLQWGLSGPAG